MGGSKGPRRFDDRGSVRRKMKKPRGRGAFLESVEARDQGRPRTGVVGVFGGFGVVVSVGKRFVQKNGLT